MGRHKGEGPYHNNPDKDLVEGGHEKRKVQPDAVSVSQGSEMWDDVDEASGKDGMAAKIPKDTDNDGN